MKSPPNLFDFATKELSQDAVICWLIAWAGTKTKEDPEEEELCRCGRELLKTLFAKWQDKSVLKLGKCVCTEVWHQKLKIDVLARVDDRYVLLIEDKTHTGPHDGQLKRYRTLVVEGKKTGLGPVNVKDLFPIYCKTGNYSLSEHRHAEKNEYRMFDRNDFLSVLETYQGRNEILLDFRRHLERWQSDTESFLEWKKDSEEWKKADKRTIRGWEGFYRWIEENCRDNFGDHWWPLRSQVGRYVGTSITLVEKSKKSMFDIWIEKDRISMRLYGATSGVCPKGMNEDKQYWAEAIIKHGPDDRFKSPGKFKATKTKPMCVAEWRGWLEFGDNGVLDLEATKKNLIKARDTLRNAIEECGVDR